MSHRNLKKRFTKPVLPVLEQDRQDAEESEDDQQGDGLEGQRLRC